MSSPSPSTRYILEQVFSNLGLLFWSFQLLPQAIQNHRTRSTGTLSPLMMLLWTLWTPIFAAGAIRSGLAVALVVQPNVFGFFGGVCLVQIWWWRGLGDGRVKEGESEKDGVVKETGESVVKETEERGEERIERDGIVKDPGERVVKETEERGEERIERDRVLNHQEEVVLKDQEDGVTKNADKGLWLSSTSTSTLNNSDPISTTPSTKSPTLPVSPPPLPPNFWPKFLLALFPCLLILGGMEVSLVYLLKTMDASLNETVQRFSTVVVSVAAFLIVGGFVPQFIEIYKTKTCHGISRLFLLFDILGGVLSLIALGLHTGNFDVVSSISYVGVVVLDIAIWVIGTFVYGF